MDNEKFEIEIDRDRFYKYAIGTHLVLGLCLFVVGLIPILVYLVVFGFSYIRRGVQVTSYWVEDGHIKIKGGVWFQFEKSIPLDKVTDFVSVQGPVMRNTGVKGIRIQTAGTGHQLPEGIIYAAIDPDKVRDRLLELRNQAMGK